MTPPGADDGGSDRGRGDGDRTPPDAADDGDEEWRFSLSDLEDDDDADNVFGPTPREGPGPIDAGDPDLENALFVVLGVAASLAVMASVLGLL